MSDQPTSETLRLVEGRESNRCIVCATDTCVRETGPA